VTIEKCCLISLNWCLGIFTGWGVPSEWPKARGNAPTWGPTALPYWCSPLQNLGRMLTFHPGLSTTLDVWQDTLIPSCGIFLFQWTYSWVSWQSRLSERSGWASTPANRSQVTLGNFGGRSAALYVCMCVRAHVFVRMYYDVRMVRMYVCTCFLTMFVDSWINSWFRRWGWKKAQNLKQTESKHV